MERFDKLLLQWLLWAILIALILGGKPWRFPQNGEFLLPQKSGPVSDQFSVQKQPSADWIGELNTDSA